MESKKADAAASVTFVSTALHLIADGIWFASNPTVITMSDFFVI
jgi:hypothetical protein